MKIIYIKMVFQVKEQLKFFQRNLEKKKTDNPKVKFVIDIINIQNNDSDKETNFHSKQDKKELTDDDDERIIISSCNNDVE